MITADRDSTEPLYRQLRRFQLCPIHVTHLRMPLPGGPRRPCARSVPARTCDHDHRSTPAPRDTGKEPERHPAQPTRRGPSTDQAGHRISGSACIPRERPWTQIRAISAGRRAVITETLAISAPQQTCGRLNMEAPGLNIHA